MVISFGNYNVSLLIMNGIMRHCIIDSVSKTTSSFYHLMQFDYELPLHFHIGRHRMENWDTHKSDLAIENILTMGKQESLSMQKYRKDFHNGKSRKFPVQISLSALA